MRVQIGKTWVPFLPLLALLSLMVFAAACGQDTTTPASSFDDSAPSETLGEAGDATSTPTPPATEPEPTVSMATPTPTVEAAPSPTATTIATPTPTPTSIPTAIAQAQVGTQIGDRAPDFVVLTVDGQTLTLSDLVAEGKSVLLYFFASW